MIIKLRPYQDLSIKKLREHIIRGLKKLILCAPTGAGKTIMFSFMVSNAVSKGKKCLILSNRSELLTQTGGALEKFGLKPIVIKPNRKIHSLNGTLYIGMSQTVKRRMNQKMYIDFVKSLDLIVIDEA